MTTTAIDGPSRLGSVNAQHWPGQPESVRLIREQAAQRFAQLGLPTTKHEEWKYTSLAPLARLDFQTENRPPERADDHDASLCGRAIAELVFINGRYAPAMCSAVVQHPGIRIVPIAQATADDRFATHFAKYADSDEHPLTALNTALAQDGAFIDIAPSTVVEGFIHLLFIGEGDAVMSHPRNLIVAGPASQITVVESYVGKGSYFTNVVTEIAAGEGAVVDHYKIGCESLQAFHIGTLQVHQERSSSVISRCITIGGALVRNEINVALAGEGASITLDGLFTLTGNQHADNHTVIDHLRPHCDSVELYKGVLDESARGIFDGRIIVRPDAQKTSSRQTNHNLLLSETAIVDSKPTLEIHNDDVKCNHGSTIGQLDEEALFYLRSRGIGESDARGLLIHAFASEIVDRMKIEAVREQVRRQMFRRMPERLPERREGSR